MRPRRAWRPTRSRSSLQPATRERRRRSRPGDACLRKGTGDLRVRKRDLLGYAASRAKVGLLPGRVVTAADVAFIRELIAEHPRPSRRALSDQLCAAWDWRQPNGALRDMVCRGLMLRLHREGSIELPPVRRASESSGGPQSRGRPVPVDTRPLRDRLAESGRWSSAGAAHAGRTALQQPARAVSLLGYTQPVGEHLKYLVYAAGPPVACLAWSSAPRTWAAGTASSAGRRRRGARTSACLPTTRAF